jgi:SagB-type dehydrogenase family enzyme
MERKNIMKKLMIACSILGLFLFISPSFSSAQDANVIKLPPPQKNGGMPLMKALNLRKSTRGDFGPAEKLSLQTLSNLLWAADGVNRPDAKQPEKGHRTAASAVDWQNIDIYITTMDGLFLYDPIKHELKVLGKQDVRGVAGTQDFVKTAPLNLIYVADLARATFQGKKMDTAEPWSWAGVGLIAQNVYLYCASENLACIIRAMFDAKAVTETLKLRPDQKPLLSQTVAQFKK